MRAIVIGFPKGGTSSIQEACVRSGLNAAHWKVGEAYCGKLIYERYMNGEDPLIDFSNYDVITQMDVCLPKLGINFWPNLDFAVLLEIRRHHPECAFILNVRDTNKLISSITRWGDLKLRCAVSDIIGLPVNFGEDDVHLHNWIEGHYRACRTIFSNDQLFFELDIDKPDAPAVLQKALGVELKWWGTHNKNENKSLSNGIHGASAL